MNETEKSKVLRHSASSIAIPVNTLPSNDQTFHGTNRVNKPFFPLLQKISRIINPHSRIVRIWRIFDIFLFLFAFLVQTLFIFLVQMNHNENCIEYNNTWLRWIMQLLLELSNIFFLFHIIITFKLAYVDPESRVLVYAPKKVALNYVFGYFIIDAFLIFPVGYKILETLLPTFTRTHNTTEVLLFLQYLAVLCRLLSLSADQSMNAFFFESWSSKFVVNLLAFFLFSHVVGALWYYFALNRVIKCLQEACVEHWCLNYIYCEPGNGYRIIDGDPASLIKWKNNNNATACFGPGGYDYGIYVQAVGLIKNSNLPMRYIYSLYWGFQQISTLAGNQTPAFFLLEVLFTMFITATGLLLFSSLIGNMQSFLQALGRRSLENSVRGSDIEQWMSHRRFPDELKGKIRESEQYNWLATRGVNELMLLENLPEDLQRDIRRHLFNIDKKLPIFASMDESILDALRERMKQKTYIKGSRVLVPGGLIDKMIFIVQGKLEIIVEAENVVPWSEGDVCCREIVALCLEHYVLNRDGENFKIPAHKLVSKRTVRCSTNVEAFTLRAADLEDVFSFYSGLLIQNPLVQGAMKKESLYPKSLLRSRSY